MLLLILALSGCSRHKDPLILTVEWQKADSDACLGCKNSGAREQDIKKAFDELSRKLAAKGIRVELVEKKAVVDTSKPEMASGLMWVGNEPVESWLGASTQSKVCPACPTGPRGYGHLHKTLIVDGQVYDPIPVDLMVRAGLSAADQLQKNAKSNAQK